MDWMQPTATVPVWLIGVAVSVAVGVLVLIAFAVWRMCRPMNQTAQPLGLVGGVTNGASPQPSEAPAARPPRDGHLITKDIATAEKRGDDQALADLYLEYARFCLQSDDDTAADTLRKSVVLASQHDLKHTHAAARLELANLSELGGDLTTACEHWQIARTLFHELERQRDVEATDARMLRNGCPTDWVLTDF